ncbi:MAG: threonine synthase, partial [Clostridia bacterium]|nr:threonine synthase [Clostridia bacterium]
GDTGSAAIEGFKNVPGTRIIVFYPETGISDVQRAQMVTVDAANVRACAVKGNFDDAQAGVKRIFGHVTPEMLSTPAHGARLSSANSINIGRLVPQVAYYISSYLTLVEFGEIAMGDKLNFSVPTGNFGDILAGYIAGRMGLPVGKLICASNANDVLPEFFRTGTYNRVRPFHVTASPSMDILVSSNLERLLYFVSDAPTTAGLMERLSQTGAYSLPEAMFEKIRTQFPAGCCDDAATLDAIGRVFRNYGYLMDPHTAVAWRVAEQQPEDGAKTVVLSTASPFKFAASVLGAIGETGTGGGFEQIRQLEACTGWKASAALTALADRAAVQSDARMPGELDDYVIERVREAQW